MTRTSRETAAGELENYSRVFYIFYSFVYFWFVETESCYVAQAGFELRILQP
jgi:hypothetical protein